MQYTQFFAYLDLPDLDYWYDEGAGIAREMLDQSSDQIFDQLLIVWRKWPVNRQEHLAYILGEGDSLKEKNLILDMRTSSNKGVKFRAEESLNEFE